MDDREFVVKTISVEEAIKGNFVLVDVRTKEEFDEFHIPGAINVPLFTNEEKIEISKVYYSRGPHEAKLVGLKFASARICDIVSTLRGLIDRDNRLAIYCWRGGLRSFAVSIFASLVGVDVYRVEGGYRAFRRFILRRIGELCHGFRFVVIYGYTGCGKTLLIKRLRSEGYPAVDLERLAGHRGSVFGGIGFIQPSQKMFDAMLWKDLECVSGANYLIVEGESRRIGRIHLPDMFWESMCGGFNVAVELPFDERVRITLENYCHKRDAYAYLHALDKIRRYLGDEKFRLIREAILREDYETAVGELMLNYYDPLYRRSEPDIVVRLRASDFGKLYAELRSFIEKRFLSESCSVG